MATSVLVEEPRHKRTYIKPRQVAGFFVYKRDTHIVGEFLCNFQYETLLAQIKEFKMKRYTIGLIAGILLTASALPLIAQEDASGLTLEKDGEQVLIPLDEWVVVSSAYGFINTVRGLYMGMTVDALRIQEKGESFEREIPMDEIGLIVTGKTKSTRDYVFQGMRIACIGTMGGVLLLGIIEPSDNSNFFGLGRGFMYALAGIYTSIFTVPAGALIGYINGQAAQGNAVEYVIGDGEWVIVK
jgi:outer membrane lipoprotein SlyB